MGARAVFNLRDGLKVESSDSGSTRAELTEAVRLWLADESPGFWDSVGITNNCFINPAYVQSVSIFDINP